MAPPVIHLRMLALPKNNRHYRRLAFRFVLKTCSVNIMPHEPNEIISDLQPQVRPHKDVSVFTSDSSVYGNIDTDRDLVKLLPNSSAPDCPK